jgi:hypothetical protein
MSESYPNLIVIYDLKVSYHDALELGFHFFKQLGLKPNELACRITPPENSRRDGVIRINSASAFDSYFKNEDFEYFVLAYVRPKEIRSKISYYYGRTRIPSDFYRLIIEYDPGTIAEMASDFNDTDLVEFIGSVAGAGNVEYGFKCSIPSRRLDAYIYSDAQALFVPFIKYENPDLWMTEVPSYLSDTPAKKRYLSGMMRLVYECNFITEKHLLMPILNRRLMDWIREDSFRGSLSQVSDKLWAWSVKKESLFDVNQACAEAGLLIAWQAPRGC